MLKISSEAIANILQNFPNEYFETGISLDNLKLADLPPVFKQRDPLDQTIYRLVNILLIVSRLFEKMKQNQINSFIINFLSPHLCSYRKRYNAQQALKKTLNYKGFGEAVLMDQSTTFDTLSHDLLII